MNGLTAQQLAFLHAYGFDADLQRRWQADLAAGRLSQQGNLTTSPLTAPPTGTLTALPPAASAPAGELHRLGTDAIARGQLGLLVLNGGMATRFGGVVKGLVPVLGPTQSFLGLVVEDARQWQRETGGAVPIHLMNSFATATATEQHFAAHGHFGIDPALVRPFSQFVALRMERNGELFRQANGDVSPYGPGHGDLTPALRHSGLLQRFRAGGGRYLLVRNVDNLGARIDATILGHHIASRRPITVELAPKHAGDVGGAPYLYQGRTQLIEGLRFPPGFDPDVVDVFNTNTFWLDAEAIDRDFDLGWYYVEKSVDGRKAVQIEHLVGELTAHLATNFLRVGRTGPTTRFLPVKTPEDLTTVRAEIERLYRR